MIITLLLNLVILLIGGLFSFLPQVTALPTIAGASMDTAVTTVYGLIHGMLTAMPFLQIVWYCLLWYYGIKITLLTWPFIRWFINLIRGAGS